MRRDMIFAIVGSITLLIAVVLFMSEYGTDLGFGATIGTDFITILPGIFCFVVGLLILGTMRASIFSFPAIALIGVGFAFLISELYTLGMITDIMLEGLTIQQLQLWCLVIACLVGALVAGLSRRS